MPGSFRAAGTLWDAPERYDAIRTALDAAVSDIPRGSFDPAAVVSAVGNDPKDLFEWVRDKTRWVPYRGALRGSTGVLLDGLGNSLDRALLLAELLRSAGHTSRLAHANLDEKTARILAGQILTKPTASLAPPAGNAQEGKTLEVYVKENGIDEAFAQQVVKSFVDRSTQTVQELIRRVNGQTAFISDAVGKPSSGQNSEDAAAVISAIRDHWWVQQSDGSRWIDLDPTLVTTQVGAAQSSASQTFPYDPKDSRLPLADEFVHQIAVRVIVEHWASGALSTNVALSQVLRPAEVIGLPINIQHVPVQGPPNSSYLLGGDPAASFERMVRDQENWLPLLTIGDKRIQQSGFNVAGELIKVDSQGRTGASRKPTDGFDALSGGGEPVEKTGVLTAEWIEFEIRVPGQSPQVVRRDVFDVLSDDSRTNRSEPSASDEVRTQRGLAMLGTIQMMPMAARLTPQFVEHTVLVGMQANHQPLAELRAAVSARNIDAFEAPMKRFTPIADRLLSLALGRFAWSPVGADVYLSKPNILLYRSTPAVDSKRRLVNRQGFDIVSNDVSVRPNSELQPFRARLIQGITDTNLEGLLMGAGAGNAGTILDKSLSQRDSWSAIRSKTDAKLKDWSGDQRRRIEDALAAGYLVFLPDKPEPAGQAWWRVHPGTGDALGIGSQGWGQSMVEVITKNSLLAVLTAFAAGFLATAMACMMLSSSYSLKGGWDINDKTSEDMKNCACAGLAGGAMFGGFIAGLITLPTGAAIGAAAIGKTAVAEATLKGFQVGMGAGMMIAGMAKEALCV